MGLWQGALEALGMTLFGGIYRGRRVLVTGHTGFKGSWLAMWLQALGAEVTGVSLPAESGPSHWEGLQLALDDRRLDIRDHDALQRVVRDARPEIVFHLAAQPLVRQSYRDPLETWSTNVMGTAHLLEACRQETDLRAIVVVTTDKCYENREWPWGYRETDPLGGHDPYSASKAASELLAASYRRAIFAQAQAPLLATARAGNVVGGGDWSQDRLVPDLVRAVEARQSLEIRSPAATRPWQHVLEPLSGYLRLGQTLWAGQGAHAQGWNFGPAPEGNRTVAEVLGELARHWSGLQWHVTAAPQPHEASLLYLDSAKAQQELRWKPVWNLDATLARTADWYRAWLEARQVISRQQLADYVSAAEKAGLAWTQP